MRNVDEPTCSAQRLQVMGLAFRAEGDLLNSALGAERGLVDDAPEPMFFPERVLQSEPTAARQQEIPT
jgi:hypothetical protein